MSLKTVLAQKTFDTYLLSKCSEGAQECKFTLNVYILNPLNNNTFSEGVNCNEAWSTAKSMKLLKNKGAFSSVP